MPRHPFQSRPTAKMARLYSQYTAQWGNPADLFVFDPRERFSRTRLPLVHVLAWLPTEDRKTTFLATLGMSDFTLPVNSQMVELRLIYRGFLPLQTRQELSKLLADVVRQPFERQVGVDWWDVIEAPGKIPVFNSCSHLLLSPKLTKQGVDKMEDEGGAIKILHVVPITEAERVLISEKGHRAFLEYVRDNQIDLLDDRADDDELEDDDVDEFEAGRSDTLRRPAAVANDDDEDEEESDDSVERGAASLAIASRGPARGTTASAGSDAMLDDFEEPDEELSAELDDADDDSDDSDDSSDDQPVPALRVSRAGGATDSEDEDEEDEEEDDSEDDSSDDGSADDSEEVVASRGKPAAPASRRPVSDDDDDFGEGLDDDLDARTPPPPPAASKPSRSRAAAAADDDEPRPRASRAAAKPAASSRTAAAKPASRASAKPASAKSSLKEAVEKPARVRASAGATARKREEAKPAPRTATAKTAAKPAAAAVVAETSRAPKKKASTRRKQTCLAATTVANDGRKVGYMYRETPIGTRDSGWRFEAGDESDKFLDDDSNIIEVDLESITSQDPDIVPLLSSDVGAAYERDPRTSRFVEAELEDDYD